MLVWVKYHHRPKTVFRERTKREWYYNLTDDIRIRIKVSSQNIENFGKIKFDDNGVKYCKNVEGFSGES